MALWRAIRLVACFGALALSAVQKRETLTDLSDGYSRSWKFGTNVAGDVLRAIGLDGGWLPADGDSNNNYLLEVSLNSSFDLSDNSNYKLRLIDEEVPNFKD